MVADSRLVLRAYRFVDTCLKSRVSGDVFAYSTLRRHINLMNRAGDVVRHLRSKYQPEMCTVAWAKMYETITTYDLLDAASPQAQNRPVTTAHLCEAPGR